MIYRIAKNGDLPLNAIWHAMSNRFLCAKNPAHKLREFESELIQDISIILVAFDSEKDLHEGDKHLYQVHCNKCESHLGSKADLIAVLHTLPYIVTEHYNVNHFVLDSTNDSEDERKNTLSRMRNVCSSNPTVKHCNDLFPTDYAFLSAYEMFYAQLRIPITQCTSMCDKQKNNTTFQSNIADALQLDEDISSKLIATIMISSLLFFDPYDHKQSQIQEQDRLLIPTYFSSCIELEDTDDTAITSIHDQDEFESIPNKKSKKKVNVFSNPAINLPMFLFRIGHIRFLRSMITNEEGIKEFEAKNDIDILNGIIPKYREQSYSKFLDDFPKLSPLMSVGGEIIPNFPGSRWKEQRPMQIKLDLESSKASNSVVSGWDDFHVNKLFGHSITPRKSKSKSFMNFQPKGNNPSYSVTRLRENLLIYPNLYAIRVFHKITETIRDHPKFPAFLKDVPNLLDESTPPIYVAHCKFPKSTIPTSVATKKSLEKLQYFACTEEFMMQLDPVFVSKLYDEHCNVLKETPFPRSFLKLMKKKVNEYESSRVSRISLYSKSPNTIHRIRFSDTSQVKYLENINLLDYLVEEPHIMECLNSSLFVGSNKEYHFGDGYPVKSSESTTKEKLSFSNTQPQYKLEWVMKANNGKLCAEGAAVNLLYYLGSTEKAKQLKMWVLLETSALIKECNFTSITEKQIKKITDDPYYKVLYLLREKFRCQFFQLVQKKWSAEQLVMNINSLQCPILISLISLGNNYNHVIAIVFHRIIDFQEQSTCDFNVENLNAICGSAFQGYDRAYALQFDNLMINQFKRLHSKFDFKIFRASIQNDRKLLQCNQHKKQKK